MYWMQKINPSLPSIVAVEYATELQSGVQITALVHQIAKRADSLLAKSSSHATKQKPSLVQNIDVEEDQVTATAAMIAKTFSNFNPRTRSDGNLGREQRRSNQPQFPKGNRSQVYGSDQMQPRAYCP